MPLALDGAGGAGADIELAEGQVVTFVLDVLPGGQGGMDMPPADPAVLVAEPSRSGAGGCRRRGTPGGGGRWCTARR